MSARKRWGGAPPWYLDAHEREEFEATVRAACSDVEARLSAHGYELRCTVAVPHYEARRVMIAFTGDELVVFADGPPQSKHRWSDGSLCMWKPSDPANRRWIRQFGAALLIELIRTHLFREAYWRETDHWPGDEAPHDPPRRSTKPRTR
jgi:hypothetical protein